MALSDDVVEALQLDRMRALQDMQTQALKHRADALAAQQGLGAGSLFNAFGQPPQQFGQQLGLQQQHFITNTNGIKFQPTVGEEKPRLTKKRYLNREMSFREELQYETNQWLRKYDDYAQRA